MDEFRDDEFGDLYADVELQVSSAINAIQALTQPPLEDEEVYGNGDENCNFQVAEEGVGSAKAEAVEEKAEEEVEGEENGNESESESEDDFNIVLNDDVDNDNANGNVSGGKVGFQSARNEGGVGNDGEYGIEGENEGNYRVETGGSRGGERGNGGKGGCSDGGYNSQYKFTRSHPTAFSSNLKSNESAAVASYSSTFIRGNHENDGCTYRFGTSLIGSQSGRNFSLPRSRTILDVNIDALKQKPWRNPGADITDFFNFGFDEDSWKSYCNHLDRHQGQTAKVTGNAAYQHARHSEDCEAGSECEVVQENIVHHKKRKAVSLTDEISCRQPQSEMLKGRAIQVENGLGERQPSAEIRLPIERDSDVVIQIPIQDLEKDHSNSDKVACDETTNYPHEGSGNGEVSVDDAGDMLCFSGSEDELPILEGPTERTGKSDPHRCFRHTSTCDCDPSCLDSDNYVSLHVSDANEQRHQMMDCDSYGTAEATKASDDPNKSVGRGKPTTISKKTPESSQSGQSQHRPISSASQNDCVGSRGGAYGNPDKFYDHSDRASPKSASEIRESITFDYHSSKGYRSQGVSMRSSNYKYIERRSPVQRNIKFQNRKSSRMSGLKNCLDDDSASHMSDAEEFNHAHHPAVKCHKQRNRHHDVDYYEDRDYLYREELEHSSTYRGARFSSNQPSTAYAGYPHGKDNQDCGYKGEQYHSRNVNEKQRFPEQRIPRLSNAVMGNNWNHYRKGISVQEMDSFNYDVSRQLITEQSPFLDNGNHTQSKRKADELHFKRRMKNDDFSAECNYSNEFRREKCRPMSYNWRERDYLENRHDRPLPYSRREVKSPLKSKRRYDSPPHDCETIWYTDYEDERSRYARNRLSFRSYREPRTAGRGRGRAALLSRNGMFERHGRQRRQNYVERYRGSNKLDGYADGYSNDDETIKGTDDHDYFVGRQYWQSEVLHWSEEEYNSRHLEDNFEVGTFYPFDRTLRYKRFDAKPGSGRGGKLIDGREPDHRRYKLPIEGDRCSQFDQSSSSVHRDNIRQTLVSCWDSTDSRMVGGDGKSSRCFEAGSLMYCGRYLDWNDDPEQKTFKDFNESHSKKAVQANSPKIDDLQDDANWREKFSDSLQNDSLDIEEGQIVTEDLKKKTVQKASASEDTTKFIGVKNSPSESATHENIDVKGLESPRIMEILAKMEKRRERFQQPITLKNVSEKHSNPFADSNAETAETKVQRPARKRKWVGS